MNEPLVSVFMMTYNHEAYIAKALDSILMQKVNFTYEIVVGEDCSTDNTRTILINYANKHPEKFNLLLHEQNIGAVNNQNAVFKNCKGKYIAMLEGDDYWIDPYKLQKQVDFLEGNEQYGMVAADVELIDAQGNSIPDNPMVLAQRENRKPTVDIFDLLDINLINTLTVCVRNDLMKQLTERVTKKKLWYVYDYWFWLQIAVTHKIRIFDEKVAAYRVHQNGISQQKGYLIHRVSHVRFDAAKQVLKQEKALTKQKKVLILTLLVGIIRAKNQSLNLRIKIGAWLIFKILYFSNVRIYQ